MMNYRCEKCGTEYPSYGKFCPKCGTPANPINQIDEIDDFEATTILPHRTLTEDNDFEATIVSPRQNVVEDDDFEATVARPRWTADDFVRSSDQSNPQPARSDYYDPNQSLKRPPYYENEASSAQTRPNDVPRNEDKSDYYQMPKDGTRYDSPSVNLPNYPPVQEEKPQKGGCLGKILLGILILVLLFGVAVVALPLLKKTGGKNETGPQETIMAAAPGESQTVPAKTEAKTEPAESVVEEHTVIQTTEMSTEAKTTEPVATEAPATEAAATEAPAEPTADTPDEIVTPHITINITKAPSTMTLGRSQILDGTIKSDHKIVKATAHVTGKDGADVITPVEITPDTNRIELRENPLNKLLKFGEIPKTGKYMLSITAIDEKGNTATFERQITVKE